MHILYTYVCAQPSACTHIGVFVFLVLKIIRDECTRYVSLILSYSSPFHLHH